LFAVAAAAASPRLAHAAASAEAAEEPARAAANAAVSPKPKLDKPKLDKAKIGQEDLGPDDFALRYYAALNQTARVNAEISRLQRLYPGYQPPADLYSAPAQGGVDEEPLWELFTADRVDDLRAAIAAKQREIANWKPSADLAQKLRRKELRKKITAYWRDGRWQDLVDYIKNEDMSGLDADVDMLWTIAEAFARTKQTNDAVNVYKTILTTSKDKQVRIATLQKSMGALRMAEVETLLAFVPDAANEFSSIMIDITRARIAAYLHDERAEEIPGADMTQFEAYAKESREANQLGLVAWYDYKRRDFHNALEWFKSAIQNGGDAMIAHGLAHTLRALDMMRDAEEVAFAWHEPLVNNVILFIDLLERDLTREIPPFIEQERLARYAKATMEAASGEGAQALGWYAYNSCQWDVALFWFERALAWFPKDATAYGYALSLRRLKKDQTYFEIANRYDGLHSKVVEILFPDGYYHPPTPCDRKDSAKLHGKALKTAAYLAPGPATIPGAAANYDPGAYTPIESQKNASAPIDQQAPRDVLHQRAMKAIKGRFPVSVAQENPLRFRPIPIAGAQGSYAVAAPPTADGPWLADPARGPMPLVARRVPGVGAMPYENYGFSLLPGWNGVETATWPPASHQVAPAGTQWASQDADPARAGLQALSGGRNNFYGRGPAAPPAPYAGPRSLPTQPSYASPSPRPAPAYGQYPQPVSR
jgi:hypothetical protein